MAIARRTLMALVALALLAPPGAAGATFSNTSPILVPDNSVGNPYPSQIGINGMAGSVTGVKVTLVDVFGSARDFDVLVAGPTGQASIAMSDTCSGTDYNHVTIAFEDAATNLLPSGLCVGFTGGTFKPTNYDTADVFPGAPVGPYPIGFSIFNGVSPNGLWRLFVLDDQIPDAGSIGGGWRLDVTTDAPAPPPKAKKKCRKKKGKAAAAAKKKKCKKKRKK
jgi:hypothetical protein